MISYILRKKKRQEAMLLPSRSCLFGIIHERTLPPCKTGYMITFPLEDCNSFSQETYDKAVKGLQINMMECRCKQRGFLMLYGHYRRHLKLLCSDILLYIQRVICTHCGKTHALIPSLIVPYSQIPKKDQQDILILMEEKKRPAPVMERNTQIDESHVRHIIRRFRQYWKERLSSMEHTTLHDSLTEPCLHTFRLQFMQIKKTFNIFFPPPT